MGDFGMHLRAVADEVQAAAKAEANAAAAEHVRAVAVERTPILTGKLRADAFVKTTETSAEVIFPGPYARRQHYELDWVHPRGGEALYLERTIVEERETCLAIMAGVLRKYIK